MNEMQLNAIQSQRKQINLLNPISTPYKCESENLHFPPRGPYW